MDTVDIWNAVLEKASVAGLQALSPSEKTIFHVNRFIVDFTCGGLSSFLFNISPDWSAVIDLASEVRKIGAADIAVLLDRVVVILSQSAASEARNETWAEFLKRVDPDDELHLVETKLDGADDVLWTHLERFTETSHTKEG